MYNLSTRSSLWVQRYTVESRLFEILGTIKTFALLVIWTCYNRLHIHDMSTESNNNVILVQKINSMNSSNRSSNKRGLTVCNCCILFSGQLHTGNIVIENNACKLLDLENWLLGLPSYHRQCIVQFKKIQVSAHRFYFIISKGWYFV